MRSVRVYPISHDPVPLNTILSANVKIFSGEAGSTLDPDRAGLKVPYELNESMLLIRIWIQVGKEIKMMQIRDTDTLNTKLYLLTDTQVPPGADKL
jgi:hypothetical protein